MRQLGEAVTVGYADDCSHALSFLCPKGGGKLPIPSPLHSRPYGWANNRLTVTEAAVASPLVDTALVAVHRMIVVRVARSTGKKRPERKAIASPKKKTPPERPPNKLARAVLFWLLDISDYSLPGLLRLCFRQTTQPRKTMKRTTARVARILMQTPSKLVQLLRVRYPWRFGRSMKGDRGTRYRC